MLVGADPVSSRLVIGHQRPGGNVTGVTALSTELIGKRLGLLKEIVPHLSRIGYMWNPANPGNVLAAEETAKIGPMIGVSVQPLPVRGADEFDWAFASMTKARTGALLVGADGMLLLHRTRLAELAIKHRIPAMYSLLAHAEAGGLLVYSADYAVVYRRIAIFIDKILRGAKPSDLPVEQPTSFEFIINLKTAKALGLTIPPSVRLRASQLIE